MAYKKSVYLKAKDMLSARRQKAEREQEQRHEEALRLCPQIGEIERLMASQGADAVKAVGMGGDAVAFIERLKNANLSAQQQRRDLLKSVGLPEDYLETEYTCPLCRDTGFHESCYCSCYQKLIREVAREELASRSMLKKCTFDTFQLAKYPEITDSNTGISQREHMGKIKRICVDYAKNFSRGSESLYFFGKTGLGKTHLSLAIANAVIDRGFDVYYDSVQNIMDALEAEHFGRAAREDSIKEDLLSCDLLIIDDLGVEFSTQFTVAELHSIVNTRILRSLPIIISSNLEPDELEEKYSQRLASRIMGSSKPLFFCGRDIRQMG